MEDHRLSALLSTSLSMSPSLLSVVVGVWEGGSHATSESSNFSMLKVVAKGGRGR